MEGIKVRGLVKHFGSVTALAGLDLDVERGEIVALLGPNGAGKTTLLRILGTTVLPDQGTATVQGIDVADDPVGARRQVGLMVGDEHSLSTGGSPAGKTSRSSVRCTAWGDVTLGFVPASSSSWSS